MKTLWIFLLFIFFPGLSRGSIYNYDKYLTGMLQRYMKKVPAEKMGAANCQTLYDKWMQDGILDLHYALGYFDDSTTGHEVISEGPPRVNYGLSPSWDPLVFAVIKNHLQQACRPQSALLTCGFTASQNHFGEIVLQKDFVLFSRTLKMQITLTKASATEFFQKNKNEKAEDQKRATEVSERNFFDGLRTADIIFYNGHSRVGGGPDFSPPVLNRNNKPDYRGYYQIQRPGLSRLLKEINDRPDSDFILGLFSCSSHRHFFKDLSTVKKDLKLVLSRDTISYFDSLYASMGLIEGMMHGACGADLKKSFQTDSVRQGFTFLNFDP